MAYDNTEHFCKHRGKQQLNSTFRGDVPPLNYNEFEWLALITVTLKCIEWEWHKSLPVNSENLWNYQIRQKCEIYMGMQWTFSIQAILDTVNAKY